MGENESVPLREYLERLISDQAEINEAKFVTFRVLIDSNSEKVALALDASDKAIAKAEAAAEKRFASVNEFRGQLNDQAREFVTRNELDEIRKGFQQRIDELSRRQDSDSGAAAARKSSVGYLIAAITIGLTIVSLIVVAANAYFK